MASRRSPHDMTGRKADELAAQRARELAEREGQLTTINPLTVQVDDDSVVDVTDSDRPRTYTAGDADLTEDERMELSMSLQPAPDDALVVSDVVTVDEGSVIMRVNTSIDCTIGMGHDYSFREGQRYKVPRRVYDWLDSLGIVWH